MAEPAGGSGLPAQQDAHRRPAGGGVAGSGGARRRRGGGARAAAQLQRRIGRRKLGRKVLAEAPVVFVAYDLLEDGGEDLRRLPLRERRRHLERLPGVAGGQLHLSSAVEGRDWRALRTLRATSRQRRRRCRAESLAVADFVALHNAYVEARVPQTP